MIKFLLFLTIINLVTISHTGVAFSFSIPQFTSTDYKSWLATNGVIDTIPIDFLPGGGAVATASFEANEKIMMIPLRLCCLAPYSDRWPTELVSAALVDDDDPKSLWIKQWRGGGWATDRTDLEIDSDNVVAGSLLTTGTDIDYEVYRKFGLPTHPLVDRAAHRVASLTACSLPAARASLISRSYAFRRAFEELQSKIPMPTNPPENWSGSLSKREKKQLAFAKLFSITAAKASVVDGSNVAVVPVHEMLLDCGQGGTANIRVEYCDPYKHGSMVALVASQAVKVGDSLVRDCSIEAPRFPDAPPPDVTPTGGSITRPPNENDSMLRLLMDCGVLRK